MVGVFKPLAIIDMITNRPRVGGYNQKRNSQYFCYAGEISQMHRELEQIKKWYVDNGSFTWDEKCKRDTWCLTNFGAYRHDVEIDEGWWLQSEEEYVLFVMRWGV